MKGAKIYDLVVIGGGAAGFFASIQAATLNPKLRILILEKSAKLLTKVRISGGGRCNVTHHSFEPAALSKHYPRGQRELKKLFHEYQAKDVVGWFHQKGVQLKAEADGRMFPITNRSETIIDCFLTEVKRLKIEIITQAPVVKLEKGKNHFTLHTDKGRYLAHNVLVATGGNPKKEFYNWITEIGHTIQRPIPSLFTFNDKSKSFADLMGISVSDARVLIEGTKFSEQGAVLSTHWGLSGPAVIKLSAWAAEYLFEKNYNFTVLVNWVGVIDEETLRRSLNEHKSLHPKQNIIGKALFNLPLRLWTKLCALSGIAEGTPWSELPKKNINRLIENLVRCRFTIQGKTTFKEEFVTCGGVPLNEVNLGTMESKKVKGLFFAGEVLDIDGETGGFNFQAAWTTAYVAAKTIADN